MAVIVLRGCLFNNSVLPPFPYSTQILTSYNLKINLHILIPRGVDIPHLGIAHVSVVAPRHSCHL